MAELKPNAKTILNYVKSMDGQNITAADISEATGIPVKSVNGTVTSAFQKKGLMERVPAEIELEDGTHKAVKFIRCTQAGLDFDPDAKTDESAE